VRLALVYPPACDLPAVRWFDRYGGVMRLVDSEHRPVILLESQWAVERIGRDKADLCLLKAAELSGTGESTTHNSSAAPAGE